MAEAKSSARFDEAKQADMDCEDCKAGAKDDSTDDAYAQEDPGMTSDEEVEAEFRAALKVKNEGEIVVSEDPATRKIAEGFSINWMDMRDAEDGTLLWQSGEWGRRMLHEEMEARVPQSILQCRSVSRELNFTSAEEIRAFRLEQRIFFKGACLEEWFFKFGYVIPGSTNSWQQTIKAAPQEMMKCAKELSGKTTIETSFYDGSTLIAKTLVRIYYV